MGIVNLTQDSFSDGGRYFLPEKAIDHARQLIADGADILDLGAESTRPGATAIAPHIEVERLAPVIDTLLAENIPLSIDTRNASTMKAVIAQGVDMINDVNGFRDAAAIAEVAAHESLAICIMHMQGEPLTMQQSPTYRHVVAQVTEFFYRQAQVLKSSGIATNRMVFDPGIGFGKTVAHNIELIKALEAMRCADAALLIGVSRKSLIGAITEKPVHQRLAGSVIGAIACISNGANIVRVHDVAETVDAIKVWQALHRA